MLQTDTYWLINTGKYIAHNGLPYIEPFTIHEGLSLVVQQWLSTIIFYAGYKVGGVLGVHLLSMFMYAVIVFMAYRLALQLAEGKRVIAAYLAIFMGVCLSIYMVPRPQIFSLSAFICQIYLLEFYIRDPRRRGLIVAGLSFLSLLLINIHAAMWPVFFLLLLPYLIDGFRFKLGKIEGQGYPTASLIAGFLVAFVAGFVNPYGHRAVTYLFKSYGDSYINAWIAEMSSPNFKDALGIIVFLIVLVVGLIYLLAQGKTRLRYGLITIGTLYMGLSSLRSFSLFIIFGIVFLAYYLKDKNVSNAMPAKRRMAILAIVISITAVIRITNVLRAGPIEEGHKPETSVLYIKNHLDLKQIRLFNSFNAGGYIEFAGIKAFIDTRAEVFTKKLNCRADILKDYCDVKTGKLHYGEFADKYSFTHFLVHTDIESLLYNYLQNDIDYRLLFQDGKYVLFERLR